jgi:malonate transporter
LFIILAAISPIFIMIGVGAVAVHLGILPRSSMRSLGTFVVHFALPCLLFRSLSHQSIGQAFNIKYLAAYTAGSLLVFFTGVLLAKYWHKRPNAIGAMVGIGMSLSNSAFIGYPIMLQFLGAKAISPLVMCMIVENIVMLPLGFALAELESGHQLSLFQVIIQTARRLSRNPLLIAILLGIVASVLHLTLPAPIAKVIDMLAAASAPVALFVIGGTLVGIQLHGMAMDIVQIGVGKLLLHPLAMFLILRPAPQQLVFAGILVASTPMLSIYPILSQKYNYEDTASAALVLVTATSFVTITCIVWTLVKFLPMMFPS